MYFSDLLSCHSVFEKKIPMTFDLQFEQSDVYYVPGEKSRKKIPSTSSIFLTGVELFPTGMSAVKAVVPESVCVCGETVPPTLTPSLHETGSI